MNLNKLQSIKFALMKKEKDIDANKADFIIYASSSFKMPKNSNVTQELFEEFVESMYKDLIKTELHSGASLGLWIEYDNEKFENAISIDTLNLIKKHSASKVNEVYEFFKMTLAK
jgi:hypothetical protein